MSPFLSLATAMPFTSYTIGRATRLSPHEAFLVPSLIRTPIPRTKPHSHQSLNLAHNEHRIYSFRPATPGTLKDVVGNFSRRTRRCHRTKVHWPPVEDTINQSSLEILVSPVLHLLSQLRSPLIKHPLQSVSTDMNDGTVCVTITSIYPNVLGSPPVTAKTPVMIFLPLNALENDEETASKLHRLSEIFRNTWSANKGSKIICTDLNSLFILQLSASQSDVVTYEHLLLDQGLVAARVTIAAYIYKALPEDAYLTFPSATGAYDPPVVHGCLPDPSPRMLPDEEVLRDYQDHRNFDLYTLMNTPPRALQFLRWKEQMKERVTLLRTVRSGDILLASAGGFAKENALLTPYWPVEVDSIPSETMECVRLVARPHGVDEATRVRFAASAAFELKILEQLAAMRHPRGATVHRCEIVSIDGQTEVPGASNLCVKLFDDRLLVMHPPEDPDESLVGPDEGWWCGWSTSEDSLRNEHAAYQQLSFAQGSLVPWYYGAHKFIQADGHCLYGILLEFVPDAKTIDDVPAMSEEHRVQLIHNARHAVRAMQHADVSQHDFHKEQLMVLQVPVPHVVMLDFASASTSTQPELHENMDYVSMLMILSDRGKGRERDATVLTHFGEQEVWDMGSNTFTDGKGGSCWVSAIDPFEWVYGEQTRKKAIDHPDSVKQYY